MFIDKLFNKVSFAFSKKPLISLFFLFIIWRISLFLLAFLGPSLIPVWGNRFPYVQEQLISTKLPYWLWSWGNFDGVHYLTIAKTFYSAYYTQTFFPFYPLLVRIFAKTIFFNNFLVSSLFISNISFILSLYFFRKLLILDRYKNYLSWIFIFLLLFPTSFYFGSIYSEGLFLLLIFASFYFARTKKWFLSALFGILASATRLFGVFLLFALLTEYFIQNKGKKKEIKPIFFISLIPLGLLFYMIYLGIKFQDPLLFWHAQPAFGAERLGSGVILLPQVIFRYLKILVTVNFKTIPFWNSLFELVSFLFAVSLLVIAHLKRIRLSYLVFSWLSLITPSLTGTFSSMPRYILVIFPIYMVLGSLKSSWLKFTLLVINMVILIISVILFTRGYWLS